MTIIPLALVSALLQLADSSGAARRAEVIASDSIGRFADEYFKNALERSHVSGAAVVVVANGRVLFSRGYGIGERERAVPVDTGRTLWRLASTSKSLTTLAVLQLVERGKLRLDDDVNAHLRAFKVPDAFGMPVTIRELLRHTSGLDDRLIGDGFLGGTPRSLTAVIASRLPRRILPPGSYLYSNYDFGLLGAVVEQVTGVSFEAYMRDSVLASLGMLRTTFEQPVPAAWAADLAQPYQFSGGTFHKWPVVYHQSSPGGGATATAADVGRYMEFLLDSGSAGGRRLLPSNSLFEAFGLDGLTDTEMFSQGFAWQSRIWNGERAVETGGDLPGYTNVLVLLPGRRVGLWVAANSGNSAVTLGFLWAFLDRYFPRPRPAGASASAGTWPGSLDEFAGTYRAARYPHFELSKLGIIPSETRVVSAPDGTLRFWGERWVRVGPLQFRGETPMVRTFERDKSGRVVAFDNMERIPCYETRNVQLGLVLFFFVSFVAVPAAWIVARVRRRGATASNDPMPALPATAIVASVLNVAFLAGIVMYFAARPSYDLMLGLSPALKVLLTLPLISLACSAWAAGAGLRESWRGHRPFLAMTGLATFAVPSIAYFVFLVHWNLLGY